MTVTTIAIQTIANPVATSASVSRGRYDQITSAVAGMTTEAIIKRFGEALPEAFASFDSKARGDALNFDVYGYDADQDVAVIQIRHAFRRYRNGFLNVRKDYVLVGRNEITGQAFRHPVSAAAVRAAIRSDYYSPAAAIRGAQKWMWGVTDKQLDASLAAGMRQGDVLLIKELRPADVKIADEMASEVTVAESHIIRAARIVKLRNGRILAENPALYHAKSQHSPVFADTDGWYSVRTADEESAWEWGERLGD